MRRNDLFFYIACISFLLIATISKAQEPHTRFYIANGGVFGDNAENANIGIWDVQAASYFVIDTIQVQSIQDLILDVYGLTAFVAAQDSIVKYDLKTLKRLQTIPYKSADFNTSPYKMALYGDLLLVGQWFDYTGENQGFLTAYNIDDLSVVYEVPEITTTPNGMTVANGLLYVSQNDKGSIDNCAPYGCYSDTLGRIEVIDIVTGQWQRTIRGEDGRDMGNLTTFRDKLYAFNAISNTIMKMDLDKEVLTYQNLSDNNITLDATYYGSRLATMGGNIFFPSPRGINQFNVNSNTVGLLIEENNVGKTIAVDGEVGPQLCVLDFDYANQGTATTYNFETGVQQKEQIVGFTPEAVAGYTYYNLTNTSNPIAAEEGFLTTNENDFFQITAKNPKTIVNLQVFNVLGQQLHTTKFAHTTLLNTSNWAKGMYILYLQQEEKTYVQKILVK